MAQSLRRPPFSAVGLLTPFERRCFSQIAPRWDVTGMRGMQAARPAQRADRSIRIVAKDEMVMPSDIGLLEGTFIPPTGSRIPSIFKRPSGFLKLTYKYLRLRWRDQFSLLVFKWASPRDGSLFRRKVKLRRSQIAPTALALYRQMYTAFAEGDSKILRKICTDGIYDSFLARIGARARGERVRWDLVKYNKRPKVVSNRGARMGMDGAGIRQAVVRICSRQRLTRYTANGQKVPGTGEERDVVEYVVVQRKYWQWKEEQWQIWGTTEETSLEDVEAWERKALE